MSGIETIGEVPGFRSVASTQTAPLSASSRAGARCSAPMNSAPGSNTAAQSEAASPGMWSIGMQERWSTERAPAAIATGTEPCELSCSTCARSVIPRSCARSPIRLRSWFEKAIDSTKMSSAVARVSDCTRASMPSTSSIQLAERVSVGDSVRKQRRDGPRLRHLVKS